MKNTEDILMHRKHRSVRAIPWLLPGARYAERAGRRRREECEDDKVDTAERKWLKKSGSLRSRYVLTRSKTLELGNIRLRAFNRGLGGVGAVGYAFGADDGDVGDTNEPKHALEIVLLEVHGSCRRTGAVLAAAR